MGENQAAIDIGVVTEVNVTAFDVVLFDEIDIPDTSSSRVL